MAYLKDLPKPKCYSCRKPATVALHNHRNAELGFYCIPCGKRALLKQEESERSD